MLPEKVALGLFLEARLQNARPRRSDAVRISEREFVRVTACILLDRNQGWNSSAFGINAPDQMPGLLGAIMTTSTSLGGTMVLK